MTTEALAPEPDEAEHDGPRLSLVKAPAPVGIEPDDEHQDDDQEHEDEQAPADLGGGALAQIGELFGPDEWRAFAAETAELLRGIAARFAGIPTRAGQALWRGTCTVAVRISNGSVILAGRTIEWFSTPDPEAKAKAKKTQKKAKKGEAVSLADDAAGWPRPVRRGVAAALVGYAAYHQVGIWSAVGAAGAWCVVALIVGAPQDEDDTATERTPEPPEKEDTTPQNDHEKSGEAPEKPTPEQAAVSLARYVEHAVAAADHIDNHKGVHTETLLDGIERTEGLRERILDPLNQRGEEWDVPRLNATLTNLGIPVHNKGIKLTINGKQRTRAGVRYDQLTKALGRRPRIPPSLVKDHTPQHPAN